MRRILVTAISGDIANGILKILQSEDNVLYGCDVNEIAVGMDLVEEFWQSKYAVDEGYLDELLEKSRKYHITHLIPVNEREIEVIGKSQEWFERQGIKVVIQKKQVLDICLDKYKTARMLQQHGILTPKTYLCSGEARICEGKYICKPRKSNGSKNICIVELGKDDFKLPDAGDYVLQEYIDSEEEYTIGAFRKDKRVNVIAFKRRLKNGYSNEVEISHDEKLFQLARSVAELLDIQGYINIQLRKQRDRYYIFEINPRISGTVRFRHMLGYTDVLWWLDMLDGKEVPEYHCAYSKAVGIRELNEKYLILEKEK